jgi:hypothetical protein
MRLAWSHQGPSVGSNSGNNNGNNNTSGSDVAMTGHVTDGQYLLSTTAVSGYDSNGLPLIHFGMSSSSNDMVSPLQSPSQNARSSQANGLAVGGAANLVAAIGSSGNGDENSLRAVGVSMLQSPQPPSTTMDGTTPIPPSSSSTTLPDRGRAYHIKRGSGMTSMVLRAAVSTRRLAHRVVARRWDLAGLLSLHFLPFFSIVAIYSIPMNAPTPSSSSWRHAPFLLALFIAGLIGSVSMPYDMRLFDPMLTFTPKQFVINAIVYSIYAVICYWAPMWFDAFPTPYSWVAGVCTSSMLLPFSLSLIH